MPNKRTVDPTGEDASSKIVGIRMTDKQIQELAELCEARGQKRSQVVRDLIRRAHEFQFSPEPF